MKFFKQPLMPLVGFEAGRLTVALWYGNILLWGLWLHKERSSEKTQWDLAFGPLNFYWYTR